MGRNDTKGVGKWQLQLPEISTVFGKIPVGAEPCESEGMPGTGVEQPHGSPGNAHVSNSGGAESGALDASTIDLERLIEAWPTLPGTVKAHISGIVEAVKLMSHTRETQ